ncbi:cytochrome P450 [Roridomyces roridus]|uniref:Cytochrome P450 n=1 Tax=Roridomyces roridus TaxID=1738132 RepID=A0AAD7CJP8_9AGAR|nr:cytochrome P450 [Roridomyces roridus]
MRSSDEGVGTSTAIPGLESHLVGLMSFLALLLLVVIPCLVLLPVAWKLSAPLNDVPYNKTWNPLGDVLGLLRASTPVDYFSQQVEKHGAICQLRLGPMGRVILVADPKEIEENLQKRAENFDKAKVVREAFVGTLRQGSVGLAAKEQWKLHRRMMTPSMSPTYLATRMNQICANVQKLLDIWAVKSRLASKYDATFECDDDIERFAMDSIMAVMLGENLHCLEDTYKSLNSLTTSELSQQGVLRLSAPFSRNYRNFRYLLQGMGSALRSGAPALVYGVLNLLPGWRTARRECYQFIESKLEQHSGGDSFVDRLLSRYPDGRPEGVSPSALLDEFATFIIGGADTPSTVMSWIIKYLTMHPQVQNRLHSELSASFKLSNNFSVTLEELQDGGFAYLDAVIHEVLRLANVGGVSARDALHDVTISGCQIPKGSQVFFLTGHSGISNAPPVEDSGITSGTFYPERWLKEESDGSFSFSSNGIPSFPFGHGPRGCPGQRFAMLELKAFLLAFNLTFFLEETVEATDAQAEMLVVLRKPSRMCIKIRKWEDGRVGI